MRHQLLPDSWEKGLGTGCPRQANGEPGALLHPVLGVGKGPHTASSPGTGQAPSVGGAALVWRTRPPSGSEPHPG